jgi:hypothetical protein
VRPAPRGLTLLLPTFLFSLANAWVDSGHMVIAEIAYDRLTPAARVQANDLLKIGGTERTRDFLGAACWADDIRRERRNTGKWHYIDLHFRTDGKPTSNQPDAKNVVWAIKKFRHILADMSEPPENRAEALRFILHFVGDVHQPLHSVSRDTDELPDGDAGGNKFPIEPPDSFESGRRPQNLHALWDLGCGLFPSTTAHFRPLTPEHREEIEAIAKKIEHDRPWSRAIVGDTNPMDWAKESLNYAKTVVYGLQEGAVPTPAYLEKGESVSETRAADAGYRLAALLNSTLK